MNATIDTINTRRSVRAYTAQAVERDKLEAVLSTGGSAPYGLTMTSRRFTAIQGAERLERANRCIRNTLRAIPVTPETHPYICKLIEKAKDDAAEFLYGAPVLVVVSEHKDSASAAVDCAASMENMMIAAHALGLGSCWLNQLPRLSHLPEVRAWMDELGIPAEHAIFASLAVGYAAPAGAGAHPRKPSEVCIVE